MRKKILMISSTWDTGYIRTLLHGMTEKLNTADAQLYVFNAYDEALESEYHLMERAIYKLPDAHNFDGVLLAVNSVGNQSAVNELAAYYKDMGILVLSMELKMDGIPSIGTDSYRAEYEMVEHMITKHGCRVFNFIGGPKEHLEGKERFQAFCDCLNDYHIPLEEKRISHYAFNEVDGIDAYHAYKKEGLHLPDAVICANDHMALGYCTAALEDGYIAPKDFRITGFDNTIDGQSYYPSITSIARNWDRLGYSSLEQILDMTEGITQDQYFKGHSLVLNESCGCCTSQRDFHHELTKAYRQKLSDKSLLAFERQSRKLFVRSNCFSDIIDQIRICEATSKVKKIAICINKSAFTDTSQDYDNEFIVFTDQGYSIQPREDNLVPKGWCPDEKIFLFSPLHFSSVNFGYCVIPFAGMDPDLDHRTFMESICLGLEGIRQHEHLRRANERLQDLYVRDSLTGMYNRFGYEHIALDFYRELQGKVYAIYLDLDNLKLLNDKYGHNMGDQAIIGVSRVLKDVFCENSIHVRMGGDEFLVIGECTGEENLLKKKELLHKQLKAYSEQEQFPLELCISEGHICNAERDLTLEEMIHLADQRMYQHKQEKKK